MKESKPYYMTDYMIDICSYLNSCNNYSKKCIKKILFLSFCTILLLKKGVKKS